ncbi:MAG TPA: hypothetical protein PLQ57_09845 [Saprospiraceae bacterium]|nr:hypothetical protein [Saprospiraceae bacterium]
MPKAISFLLLMSCLYTGLISQVNWQKMSSPNEDISCLAIGSDNILYAGTPTYGVFKSTDEGDHWNNISLGLPDSIIREMEVSTDLSVFCATGNHGVYRYTGGSWSDVNVGLPPGTFYAVDIVRALNGVMYMMNTNGAVYKWEGSMWSDVTYNMPAFGKCLAISPSGQLYAGVFNSGVYHFNGVNSWTLVGDPMPNNFVIKMAISQEDTIVAVCNSNNLFRCHTSGGAWQSVNSGLPAVNMTGISIDYQNRWFLGTSSSPGTLYRSVNNGGTWSQIAGNVKTTRYNALSVSTTKVYAGASGVFRSDDGGDNWIDKNSGMDAARIMLCFKCTNNGTFYIGNKLGVWRSNNSGQTWQLKNTGINHLNVLQIMETSTGDLLMHAYNNVPKGAIYRSVNQGDTWTQVAANGCDFYTKIKQHKADTIWASSRFSGATSLSFSVNNGATWQNNPLMISAIWDIDVSKDNTIFLGSESEGVSRSDNGGQNFVLGVGNTIAWYGNLLEIERDESGVIFAGGDWWTNILWYSTPEDNGNLWTKFNDPDLIVKGVQDLVLDYHNNVYLACEHNGCRMAYHSAWNPETNWLPCNTGLPSPTSNLLEMGFDTSGFLYSVVSASNGHNAGLFRSVAEVNPPKSSVYQFTGNGAWSDPNNWANANKPGLNVGGNKIVIINPGPNGECILDQPLNLSNGAKLKIYPGKKFTILD